MAHSKMVVCTPHMPWQPIACTASELRVAGWDGPNCNRKCSSVSVLKFGAQSDNAAFQKPIQELSFLAIVMLHIHMPNICKCNKGANLEIPVCDGVEDPDCNFYCPNLSAAGTLQSSSRTPGITRQATETA